MGRIFRDFPPKVLDARNISYFGVREIFLNFLLTIL